MATWREMEEASDDNMIGLCRLDFSMNFGVNNDWTTPSTDEDQQEEPMDVTP